jgi:hypothetical protein
MDILMRWRWCEIRNFPLVICIISAKLITVLVLQAQDLKNKQVYCHNPTNNPKQLKTTFVGVVLLSVRKNHHTTKPPPPHGFHYS